MIPTYLLLLLASAVLPALASHAVASASLCSSVQSQCAAPSEQTSLSAYCSSYFKIRPTTVTSAKHTITVAPICTPASIPPPSESTPPHFRKKPEAVTAAVDLQAHKSPVPRPSCFPASGGFSARVSDCNCFTFTTRTLKTTISTATVTGPFYVEASGGDWSGGYPDLGSAAKKPYYISFDTYQANSKLFVLNENKWLMLEDRQTIVAERNFNAEAGIVYITTTDNLQSSNGGQPYSVPLVCDIAESNCALDCRVNDIYKDDYTCYGGLWVTNRYHHRCTPFLPVVNYVGVR